MLGPEINEGAPVEDAQFWFCSMLPFWEQETASL
jgi:hypothetical protein